MIVNFSVENFASFKERQTLSFEADNDKHLDDTYIIKAGGKRLLKLALIFGANASGKTNFLKALQFLGRIVNHPLESKSDELKFNPFLFDPVTTSRSSFLSIEFIQKKIRYKYEIYFTSKSILKENLFSFNPKKAVVYERITSLKEQLTKINFGSKVDIGKEVKRNLEANTLWNNTVLGGFLKTNLKHKDLKDVTDWFKNYLKPVVFSQTSLTDYVMDQLEKKLMNKQLLIGLLKKADFQITDLFLKKESRKVSNEFVSFLQRNTGITEEEANHLRKGKELTFTEIEFLHDFNGKIFPLSFHLESQGTKRYFGYSGLLSLLINESNLIPIDELESSLHPDLFIHFLLTFLVNSKSSQLIATTHFREFLDNKDLFRNDAIWFTERSEYGATRLFSLNDFDSSVIRNTSNILNAYKAGRLGAVPNLSDYYIDLKDEK